MMTVLQVQCLLKALGYDPGDIDGIWGNTTSQALLKFQTDYGGITCDGYPGTQTDKALRHAVCYGIPEKNVTDTADSAEKNVTDTTDSTEKKVAGAADESALKYLQSDGYYHIPKDKDIKLSKNFSSREFRCGLGSPCPACTETVINPKLVDIVQMVRDEFKSTVTITSGYRCPTYNSRIGGATGSRHSKGDAGDITVTGRSPRTIARFLEKQGVKGIGLYESTADGFFVHADTREAKSFWYGQAQSDMTTFE